MDNLPTFLGVIGATSAILLLIISIWGNWNDARKARNLEARWNAYLARERARVRREEEAKAKPIEWPKADEYLDPAHLEVRHEMYNAKGESVPVQQKTATFSGKAL
jgi:hypothetical protein